jgi:NADPH:quinone reductase
VQVRAIVYSEAGGPEVLRLVDRPEPLPGRGEVRVRLHVSGVNPTDWKGRSRGPSWAAADAGEVVPNQDGAGVIDAVGEGVPQDRVGERVWVWEAAWQRTEGTAQELVVLPSRQVVRMPDAASFELGASLGIPALTAHRCLTVAENGRRSLAPGALPDMTVLVAGGAGAVGHATIQLARWAGARVIATASGDEKARLARAAGAEHVVNYRDESAAEEIRTHAPDGVDLIVEVAPGSTPISTPP